MDLAQFLYAHRACYQLQNDTFSLIMAPSKLELLSIKDPPFSKSKIVNNLQYYWVL